MGLGLGFRGLFEGSIAAEGRGGRTKEAASANNDPSWCAV